MKLTSFAMRVQIIKDPQYSLVYGGIYQNLYQTLFIYIGPYKECLKVKYNKII